MVSNSHSYASAQICACYLSPSSAKRPGLGLCSPGKGFGSSISAGSRILSPTQAAPHCTHTTYGTTLPPPSTAMFHQTCPQKPLSWLNSASLGATYLHSSVALLHHCFCLRWPSIPLAGADVPYGMILSRGSTSSFNDFSGNIKQMLSSTPLTYDFGGCKCWSFGWVVLSSANLAIESQR